MKSGRAFVLILICAAAVSRAGIVYFARMDDPAGWIRLAGTIAAAAVWYLVERGKFDRGAEYFAPAYWVSLGLLAAYGASLFLLPNLAQALIGMAALGFAFTAAYPASEGGSRFAYAAILPLSLPVEPTLQFMIGYPLRKFTGAVASLILAPYGTRLEGTTLRAGNCLLDVDAPCSGVRGLALFLLIGAFAALARKEKLPGLIFILGASFICALFYNILRSAWLFMAQYHTGRITEFAHNAVGAAAFAAGLAALFGLTALSNKLFHRGGAS